MSEKLQPLSLAEIKSIILRCKTENCGAVLEVPLATFTKHARSADQYQCSVCGAGFGILKQLFSDLMDLMACVTAHDPHVQVEFGIPARDVCRLDR